jgi:hypothetical protein
VLKLLVLAALILVMVKSTCLLRRSKQAIGAQVVGTV